jgi:hypothetical protein
LADSLFYFLKFFQKKTVMAQPKQVYNAKDEQQLMTDIWSPAIADDPYAFVMFTFPWGKPKTPLEHQAGPRKWQAKQLKRIGKHIQDGELAKAQKAIAKMLRRAVASGRGIGKSALVAWLVLWMLSTRLGSSTIVTANNEQQLKSRTWAEVGKWHAMAINSHWFEKMAMALKPAPWFEELLKNQLKIDTGYYYAQAQLWSEETPDAFAGVHNHNGVMLIFDEASGIPQAIWGVSEGFFTEPTIDRYWFAFSNPRRNTGAFFECFHKNRDFWEGESIDSRTVEGTDLAIYEQIIKQHGADSDEARVEVYGQFPRQGDKQFISREAIDNAAARELVPDRGAALIMAADIARYGDDECVVRFRQGRDARSIPPVRWKSMDTVYSANRIAELIDKYNPDAVCIDGGGVGGGVVDILKSRGYKVIEVQFGAKADDDRWGNKRTEMWALLRDDMGVLCIDGEQRLADDLAGPQYGFMGSSDKIILEPKEKMKARGMHSPDDGDALALTYAARIARKDTRTSRNHRQQRVATHLDYDIFG